MVFLAGLWVEVVPVFEALSAGAGSWSMSLSSGVRAISRRFSDNGLKRRTLCHAAPANPAIVVAASADSASQLGTPPWHRSERGLTSNEDRQ